MSERAHNAASEFARVVRAGTLRDHTETLAGKYSTPFARALAALGIRQFNKVEPIKSWRRGQAKPRAWAVQILRDKLESEAELLYEISEQLRHEIGPGANGTEALRQWREQKSRENQKKE